MWVVWTFLVGIIITTSDTFLLTGMTATLKTYSEHFPWFIPDGNSSLRNMIVTSSSLDVTTEKPATLKEYLEEHPTDHINNHQNYSSGTLAGSKVVVVARIGDYDNETGEEWAIIAEPKERNETLYEYNNTNNGFENSTESNDYFLGNDDFQKYLNDYQDLLYTFKDFVKIGANPSIRKNISQYNVSNENSEKTFNVTYVMPIPKTKKYFEIKLSNLTKTQYNEINILLQKHIIKRHNSTQTITSKEQEIVHVDENTMGNNFISRALLDLKSSDSQTSKTMLLNNRFNKNLQSENEPKPDYFGPLLTPEGFNYFLNNFDSIHINLNNKSVDKDIFQPNNSPALIQNNGFHAEIATDYVKRYDTSGENNAHEESFSQTNSNTKNLSNSSYEPVWSASPILSPRLRRNRTKLFSQTRSKRPIMNAPDNVLNTRYRKLSPTSASITGQIITIVSSTLPPDYNNNTLKSHFDLINMSSNPVKDKDLEITSVDSSQNISTDKDSKISETNTTTSISAEDWLEIYRLYNGTVDKIHKPSHVMEAAEWLIDMKRKMEEEERKKTERYKNYIKQFLKGDEGAIFLGKENNGNIMKINKQENILEELKSLMLDYFASLDFKSQGSITKNTSSAVQSIRNTTNIFELMEQSSQLVKLNLNMKLQPESQEPTKFVKRIVEKQVEKCKRIFGKGLLSGDKQKSPNLTQKSGHRRFMVFTNCMNFWLKRCIKGFTLWLEKGKFFLRPQFKLARAYDHYEIERNIYCVRNYNPLSLGSNPHGVRVKPGPKVNRKSGARNMGARKKKQRFGIRANKDTKLKNGEKITKSARSNIGSNIKHKQQRIFKQKPKVHRYPTDSRIEK